MVRGYCGECTLCECSCGECDEECDEDCDPVCPSRFSSLTRQCETDHSQSDSRSHPGPEHIEGSQSTASPVVISVSPGGTTQPA